MIKFKLIILLYLIILLNIQCVGKQIRVSLKIKDDWEEKREFIYLKNVELKERFLLKIIEKKNKFRYCSPDYNMEGFLHPVQLNLEKNNFNVEIMTGHISQLFN
uniref:Uncharacterized protein n=1 Tax=Meloidogyne enterolobii TaxID=390850 RepID=A0A6V7W2R2_MELEN|nr:unnamed protein product [Meloidogyne enterolobii]